MGNIFGAKRKAVKVMKVDGTTLKFKPPVTAREALDGYPGHVIMDAEDVKRLGVRSPPLDPSQPLKPNKLYFLVELPKPPPVDRFYPRGGERRVQSGVNMTAKDRLETLMLKRRAESDITSLVSRVPAEEGATSAEGGMRVRMRLPKSQVARLVDQSGNSSETAEKIMELFLKKNGGVAPNPRGTGEMVTRSEELVSLKKERRMRFAQEPEIIG